MSRTVTKCKVCKTQPVIRIGAQVCGVACAEIFSQIIRDKKRKQKDRVERRNDAKRREKLKSKRDYMNDAQSAFNRYVNLRDKHLPCIACGKSPHEGVRHASHYKSRGSNSYLTFNLWNLHSCCYSCNVSKSGNIGEMRIGMIKKIGIEKVEWLENAQRSREYSIEYLNRIKKVFIKKYKRLGSVSV